MADVLTEIPVSPDPDQTFAVQLAGQRLFFHLWWNAMGAFWSFDLAVNDVPVLHGRRIVTGVDLLGAFSLGVGALYAFDPTGSGPEPTIESLSAGPIKLLHYGPEN